MEEPPGSVTDRLLCQESPSSPCAHFSHLVLRVWGYQTGGAQCSMGEKQHQPNPSLSLCSHWSMERWPAPGLLDVQSELNQRQGFQSHIFMLNSCRVE